MTDPDGPMTLLRSRARRALVAGLLAGLLAACSTGTATSPVDAPTTGDLALDEDVVPEPSPTDDPSTEDVPTEEPSAAALSDDELAALNVNELGRIPVLEWHAIQDTNGRWSNSLETFRAQLAEVHARGYRPISLDEFIDGDVDLPAGLSPVLLTFDDSYKEHFFFGDDGEPHPDSVVGILQAMHAEDPTWRPLATFAFYWPYPFRETDRELIERKLRWLVDNGFDLSNHTYNHDNLRDMADDEVVENLARAERELAEVVGEDHRLRSITLTQGIWPRNRELAMRGTAADGFTYQHDIALEVGFQPTRSPFHVDYDPMNVQRVQAWLPEFRTWLDWLDEVPGRRFVSDGDATTVAFPAGFAEVAGDLRGLQPRPYDGEPQPSLHLPEACVSGEDGSPTDCRVPGEPIED